MIFEFLRKLVCPFEEIEKYVPKKGKILDIGCGHGIFSRQLALSSPKRTVLGIDPSEKKIKKALTENGHLINLSFKKTYIENLKSGKFQGITVIDVLYLLPPTEKAKMFNKIYQLLSKHGILIIKLEVTKPSWIFYLLKLEEVMMVKYLNFTFSGYKKFYYMDPGKYKKVLEEAGFKVQLEKVIKSLIPYQHPIFVATKIVRNIAPDRRYVS